MANRYIDKIDIDGKALKKAIIDSGYSIRSISEKLSRSDRQLRLYLADNAADSDDFISDSESVSHLFVGFLFLSLRSDHHKVDHGDQKYHQH